MFWPISHRIVYYMVVIGLTRKFPYSSLIYHIVHWFILFMFWPIFYRIIFYNHSWLICWICISLQKPKCLFLVPRFSCYFYLTHLIENMWLNLALFHPFFILEEVLVIYYNHKVIICVHKPFSLCQYIITIFIHKPFISLLGHTHSHIFFHHWGVKLLNLA